MRIKSKVIKIMPNSNENAIEQALDTWLNQGWIVVGIYNIGTITYAVLTRVIAE